MKPSLFVPLLLCFSLTGCATMTALGELLAPEQQYEEKTVTNPETGEEETVRVPVEDFDVWSVVDPALEFGKTLGFSFGGLETILAFLVPRKRKHYGNAIKALGSGNVAGVLTSVGSALGMAHSSKGSKDAFESETA